jgi:glutamyl-Q tRNA(Asp) synthetase
MPDFVTRFAPSPTGPLHLGHAYSAMLAHDMAMAAGGDFLLRIEDIDQSRARPQWEAQIADDLHWLGLSWPEPVMRQSQRLPAYRAALESLWERELLYICRCTRRDIAAAASAPQEGAADQGPDGPIYPGSCRHAAFQPPPGSPLPKGEVLRLDVQRAAMMTATPALDGPARRSGDIYWREEGEVAERGMIERRPEFYVRHVGDVVLARREMETSYHLSVVVDDAAQGITHVVRGADLAGATAIHVLLQRLMGVSSPIYHHHRLIRDDTGRRLAKRDDARAVAQYRQQGLSPRDIRRLVGLPDL